MISRGTPPGRKPAADEFVVGLFGGSFAWHLARDSNALLESLDKTPTLRGKKVRLISAAIPSGRQPQQLYALSYLLLSNYRFDVAVNLDGFNEIEHSYENALKHSVPFFPVLWGDLLTCADKAEKVARIGKLRILREARREISARMNRTFLLDHSALANVAWRALDASLSRRIYEAVEHVKALDAESTNPHDYLRKGPFYTWESDEQLEERLNEDIMRVWLDSSIQMNAIARSKGILYLHMLQPNQYLSGSKRISEEERVTAFVHDENEEGGSPAVTISHFYPLMRKAGALLLGRGVAFVDLTQIFRDVSGTVYRDNCCHVNALGNQLLAERIAKEIDSRLAVRSHLPRQVVR